MSVFSFPVEANNTGTKEYLVRTASYGDGYQQSSGEGINSSRKTWSISFSGRKSKVDEVRSFLDERAGYKSFAWTDPNGETALYKAEKYDILPYARDVQKLTTTFTQTFSP
jgi:phage-related protein